MKLLPTNELPRRHVYMRLCCHLVTSQWLMEYAATTCTDRRIIRLVHPDDNVCLHSGWIFTWPKTFDSYHSILSYIYRLGNPESGVCILSVDCESCVWSMYPACGM